jgi:predicted AlkP superfamily phosphohydrolase/phosphomutase
MKSIMLGFDAFDPELFERLHNQGKMPNLTKYVEKTGYSRFKIANPPQSEVSWTSIATGLNPGGHGIFDFVHRDPESYNLFVSLLPTKSSVLGTTFIHPFQAETFFSAAVKDGYPATSLWWPATFPARQGSPVHTVPGLGTPDVFGQLGVGHLFSFEPVNDHHIRKTRISPLTSLGKDRYSGKITGPTSQGSPSANPACLEVNLTILEEELANLQIGKLTLQLKEGMWTPILELKFNLGRLASIKVLTQAILTRTHPYPELYFAPLQIHPFSSPWPYGTPKGFLKDICRSSGLFPTSGWPQDTTALEEGILTDEQFLDLCNQIFTERANIFLDQLEKFQEGILACVFDTLDRVQHMFWKTRPDIIEKWYLKLDQLAGLVNQKVASRSDEGKTRLLILSDHGFKGFDYQVHLNRWLISNGYLSAKPDSGVNNLASADWGKSQAYALGLNSLYLNLEGREKEGIIPSAEKTSLLNKIQGELECWSGPDRKPIFHQVHLNQDVFSGPLSSHGPDIVLGFTPGYRASRETGLGGWKDDSIEENTGHWEADHCFDAETVPGVIFLNQGLENISYPSYLDIPQIMLGRNTDGKLSSTPVLSDEDQEILRERLKGLGYL